MDRERCCQEAGAARQSAPLLKACRNNPSIAPQHVELASEKAASAGGNCLSISFVADMKDDEVEWYRSTIPDAQEIVNIFLHSGGASA